MIEQLTTRSPTDTIKFGVGAIVATIFVIVVTFQGESIQVLTLEELSTDAADVSAFSTCDDQPIVVAPLSKDVPPPHPFWLSSYPSSGANAIGNIVRGLSGDIHGSHKSYYAKSKGMKKCFGGAAATVTCEQIHPIVGIGPTPENQVQKFQSKILLALRNPLTVAPASYQDKAERYHHAEGQVSVDSWRQFRDAWLENGVYDGWQNVTTTWHDMKGYEGIAMYLPFEHLLDTEKGPELTLRLAHVLKEAGFPVAADKDIPCVWYQAIGQHLKSTHPLYEYATDYVPAYTSKQKKYLVQRMGQLSERYPDDADLQEILAEYSTDIENDKSNDKRWTNTTHVRG